MFSLFSALSGLVSGFAMLLIFRALMGIAEGPVLPIAQSLMVKSQPQRRGFNMGLIQGRRRGCWRHYRAAVDHLSGAEMGLEHGVSSDHRAGHHSGVADHRYVNGKKDRFQRRAGGRQVANKAAYGELFKIKNGAVHSDFLRVRHPFMIIITFTPTFW